MVKAQMKFKLLKLGVLKGQFSRTEITEISIQAIITRSSDLLERQLDDALDSF